MGYTERLEIADGTWVKDELLYTSFVPTLLTLERIPELNIDEDILQHYSNQIQLCLTMNSIHTTLYLAQKN